MKHTIDKKRSDEEKCNSCGEKVEVFKYKDENENTICGHCKYAGVMI